MKRLDILCPSQASTAICLSMDQASCSSSNTIQLGGKTIDRHNPIINDSRRSTSKIVTYNDHQKAKKESSSKPISKEENNNKKISKKGHEQKKKKTIEEKVTENVTNNNYYSSKPIDSVLSRSWIKPNADLTTTPAGSTRCFLSDSALLDGISDYDPFLASSTSFDSKKVQVVHQDEIITSSKPSSSSSLPKSGSSDQQVVVLRVSLHCKGCEGKVRKHISRMQGVSSFNIDFAAKKVTIVGDVTPLSVLESISKVKNAQFWSASASASAIGYGAIETKKNNVYN